jgi:uncharacterized coiled-coil DUF342 family protein
LVADFENACLPFSSFESLNRLLELNMAAVVVDGSVSSANWKKDKPKDYNGSALDSALAAYEKLVGKKVTKPTIPAMPKDAAKAYEDCVKELETAAKEMKTAAGHLKDLAKALDAVNSAAKGTEKELRKLCDDSTDKEKRKAFLAGASTASAIAAQAADASAKIK